MKKFLLIYNPLAGDSYFKYRLDYVIERFQQKNCLIIPVRTMRNQAVSEYLITARKFGIDGVIAAGGDGTLHQVVNGMIEVGLDCPLGIIPSGTCNDFAAFLGLDGDVDWCIEVIASGRYKAVDIGRVNNQYFINVASAGLMTSVAHETDTILKNTLGKVAYYLKGIEELPSFRTLRVKINVDGRKIEDEIYLFLVANSRTVGSFRNVAPNAKLDDGKLDFLVVYKCGISELMRLFISILTGNHIRHRSVEYFQAARIDIECDEEVQSDLDGEAGPKLPLRIEAVPGKLKVFY